MGKMSKNGKTQQKIQQHIFGFNVEYGDHSLGSRSHAFFKYSILSKTPQINF